MEETHVWGNASLRSFSLNASHKINIYTRCFFVFFLQRGKQHWRGGDSFGDNFDNNSFNARNNSQQRNDRRFSNPHRNEEYRSYEERQFGSGGASFDTRKGGKEFVSNRGFRFNNETRRKKSNPQYWKRYTF